MFIQTDTTPNEQSLKFRPGVPVLKDSSTVEFLSHRDAMKSPLVKKLFHVDGVRSVLLGSDFITVTKDQVYSEGKKVVVYLANAD